MASRRRIVLQGFEDAVATHIAGSFRFPTLALKDLELKTGKYIFVQDMPEIEEIQQLASQNNEDYRPEEEPTISIYTDSGPGLVAEVGAGSKLEWALRFVVRLGTVPENVKERLEELMEFVLDMRGAKISGFIVKGVFLTTRPQVFARVGDDHAFASCVTRILAVALP